MGDLRQTDSADAPLPTDWQLEMLRAYVMFGAIDPEDIDEFGIWGNAKHLIEYWTPDLRRRKALKQLRHPETKQFMKERGSLDVDKRILKKIIPGHKPGLADITPGRKPRISDVIPGRKPNIGMLIPGHQPTISDVLPGHIKPRFSDLPRVLPHAGIPRLRTYEEWMRHYDQWWRDYNELPQGDQRGSAPAGNADRWNHMYDDWMAGYRGWYDANIHRWERKPPDTKPPTAPKDRDSDKTTSKPGPTPFNPPKPAPEPKRRLDRGTEILKGEGFELVSGDPMNTTGPVIYRSKDGYELRRYGGAGTGDPVRWELYDQNGNLISGGEGESSMSIGGAIQRIKQEREGALQGAENKPPVFAQFPSKEFEREQGGNGSQEVYMTNDGYAVIREKYKNDEPEDATPWMAVTPDGEILGEYRTPEEAETAVRKFKRLANVRT